jgi:subtilisin family serine protease
MFVFLVMTTAAFAGQFIPVSGNKMPGEYIVVLRSDFQGQAINNSAVALASVYRARVAQIWAHALSGALFTNMSSVDARALAQHPDVAFVEENGFMHIITTQNPTPSWGLDRIDQQQLPLNQTYTYNFDGTGVHVYIIDTGIRATHTEFGGRADAVYDAIGDGHNGNDCNGHGTHVAGTIGGSTYGVAKLVSLHAVRVLDCQGSGSYAQVINGVDWVTQHHLAPAVANMSLGGSTSNTVDLAVNNSVAAGVFYAVAAGNGYHDDACNHSPARAASAYTVAASTIDDILANYSNVGNCVAIFAPGSAITSAWNSSDTASNTISGTSMATPHVAGGAVLLLQKHPTWTPLDVQQALTQAATPNVLTGIPVGTPNLLLYTVLGGSTITPAEIMAVLSVLY